MTATAVEVRGPGRTGRRGLGLAAILIPLALAVFLLGRSPGQGPPLHPDTTSPVGLRALVVLLEDVGAEVVTVDRLSRHDLDGFDTVLVPVPSDSTETDVEAWTEYAEGGGRLVVTGGLEGVTPEWEDAFDAEDMLYAGYYSSPTRDPADCDVDQLDGAGPLDVGLRSELPVPVLFDSGEGDQTCYGSDDEAFVTVEERGDGTIVSVGSAGTFSVAGIISPRGGDTDPMNPFGSEPREIEDASDLNDNGFVAVRLLGAGDGSRIGIIEGDLDPPALLVEGAGRDPLELMSNPVKVAILQIFVAGALYLAWRGRRLGAVVAEASPVRISGSEFVAASGDLLRRHGHPARAAAELRTGFRRAVATRIGLTPDVDNGTFAAALADRTGTDRAEIVAVLEWPVQTDEALLQTALKLDRIRTEVLHGPR